MFKLGGACFRCGTDKHLDFDCIEPQGDAHHRLDTARRISFYRQQHVEGNLQLLCRYKCHKIKNKEDFLKKQENEPF